MPAGRPSTYDPMYCDQVIELGKTGASIVEMACDIGVSRTTLERNWPAEHPEFMQALERATAESQAWWEKAGRDGMLANNISAPIWARSMAARFPNDWRERRDDTVTVKGDVGEMIKAARNRG
jgi:Helix-turn-helix domain of resolvase